MASTPGVLLVTVESARDIYLGRRHRRHDVYCVVRVGTQVASTQVAVDNGDIAVWNQTFQCQLLNETCLELEVKDAHAGRRHHARRASLPLAGVLASAASSAPGTPQRLEVPVFIQRRITRQQAGAVRLALTYWPPSGMHHHQQQQQQQQPTPVAAAAASPGLAPTPAAAPTASAATDAARAQAAAEAKLGSTAWPQPAAAAPPASAPQGVCIGIPVAPAGYYPPVPGAVPPPQLQPQPVQVSHRVPSAPAPAYSLSGAGLFHDPVGYARSVLGGTSDVIRSTGQQVARTAAQASEAMAAVLGGGGGRPVQQRPLRS